MRLSKIFSIFSGPIALVAADIGVSARAFYLARIFTSLFAFFLFMVLGYSGAFLPVYLNLGSFLGYKVFALEETLLKLIVVFVFFNSFLGDAVVNFEKKAKKKQKEEALLSFFEQISDAAIIFGALAFLTLRGSYYNIGSFRLFDLSYVEPKAEGHALLGLIALVGILFAKYAANSTKKELALSFGAERAFWLGIFSFIGFYFGAFAGAIFSGIALLAVSLYLSALLSYTSAETFEAVLKVLAAFFSAILSGIKRLLKTARKLIGVSLLWIYYIFEGIFEKLDDAKRIMKRSIKLPRIQVRKPEQRKKEQIKPEQAATEPAKPEGAVEEKPPEQMKAEAPEPEASPKAETEAKREAEPDAKGIYLGESLLVEYAPEDNKIAVLEHISKVATEEKRSAALILTQPLTQQFKEMLKGSAEEGSLKIVNLTGENISPTKEEIPMTQLEYFTDLFEALSTGSVIVFEPVSNLMLSIGTAQAYKFISSTIEKLAQKSITFIAFINKEGHEKRDISNFENLFMHIAEIKEGRLKRMR